MLWFKQLDIVAKLGFGLLFIMLIVGLVAVVNHFTDRAFENAEQAGASNVRVIIAEEGLSNVETANKAAAEVRSDPIVRDADCVRDSRTPENC